MTPLGLRASVPRLRQGLGENVIQIPDTKAAELILKAHDKIDQRMHGAVIQNIRHSVENKNTNVNVNVDAKADLTNPVPKEKLLEASESIKNLDKEIEELQKSNESIRSKPSDTEGENIIEVEGTRED